jgi:serine/threonine protein kinase/tetratricopeptide (TPR) repeat protein
VSETPPRDWSAIKALFFEAVELDGNRRKAFLDRACGADTELRSEVESLLAAHDDRRPFLETLPVAGVASALHDAFAVTEAVSTGLEQGTRIAQYEVLERVGSGGMGDVYRARDTKLDRFVALKVVREPATGRTADRVLREARAASALNHPNICTLFEASEFEGRPYLAMEYIVGQPLSSVMAPEGLHASVVVEYARQIADALAHAHDHGVIHRDLKSANVVVTPQGRAKVLDFGIAKRATTAGAGTLSGTVSEAGTISGTLAYMAPELLRESPADARSDIWALGVLLYELASGRRPFVGGTAFELSSAILKDPVPELPPTLPSSLRAVILRCLERDPEARFQQASDVITSLDASTRSYSSPLSWARHPDRRVLGLTAGIALVLAGYAAYDWRGRRATSVSEAPATTIAVLPFNVLSGREEIRFLGIGVPDTIISRIALVRRIRVMALLAPGKESGDPRSVGRTLGVEYVLTGTIQMVGDQIRVTPQLVRVVDGIAFWSRPYTLRTTDLLRLQDEIARGVVAALPVQLTSEDRARVDRQDTRDPEAYALYLRGRAQLAPNSPAATLEAVTAFEQALTKDPEYPLAHAGLAIASARMRLMFAAEDEIDVFNSKAHQAAQRALALDPELAETHEALAAVYRSSEFEWPQAIEESTRALERNPSLDQPHLFKASAFLHLGLLTLVAPAAQAARDSNRANVAEPLRVMGASATYAGQYAAAVSLLDQAREASGDPGEWNLAYAYYYAGRAEEAETMLRNMRGKSARSQRRAQATLASFLAAKRESAGAWKLIDAVTTGSYMDHHVAYSLAAAYAQLGRPAEALKWLADAWNTGFQCYPWIERDPLLAPIRQSSQFRRVFDEFKQSWETKKAQYGVTQ